MTRILQRNKQKNTHETSERTKKHFNYYHHHINYIKNYNRKIMRCVIGANGHFHRAPSTASTSSRRPSNVTGKIGSRARRSNIVNTRKRGTNEYDNASKQKNKLIQAHIQKFKELSFGENYNVKNNYKSNSVITGDKTINGSINSSRKPYSSSSISRAPFASRDSNVSSYDKKVASAKRELNKQKLQNKVKRDPLGGSKSWSGQVPNVIIKDLFSSERVKIRDLIEGKIAVIDFWLSQVGKNRFTSMDA